MNVCRTLILWTLPIVALQPANIAWGKPEYLGQVRALLIVRASRCTTCHTESQGTALNPYGNRIHDREPGITIADRIAALEAPPSPNATDEEKEVQKKNQDVDGDGLPNWIEILAYSNPADGAVRPEQSRVERLQKVVSCSLCHTSVNVPGKDGVEAHPHNELGDRLARAAALAPRSSGQVSEGEEEIRRQAERRPILTRLSEVGEKRPKGSQATYWEKIRLYRNPADPQDKPSKKSLIKLRKHVKRQKSPAKRDPEKGFDHERHPPDGFLKDAKGLE